MVLPYLSAALPQYDPDIADKLILQEIARTLRPKGKLYLTVRNRFCLHRLKRLTVSLTMENVADNFVTHGERYYHGLLESTGLGHIEAYWPVPDYKYPDYFVPLSAGAAGSLSNAKDAAVIKRHIVRLMNRAGMLGYLAETFAFVSEKLECS
jgi:hypothetical protein